MKKFILIAFLFLSTTIANAEEQSERAEQNDVCAEGVIYDPYTEDIVEAGQIFQTTLTFSTCALRAQLKAKKEVYLSLTGFQKVGGGYKISYLVRDFTKYPKLTEKDCTTTSKFIHPPGGMWDSFQEVFSKPVCGPEIITQDIDPKTGKITEYPR